MTCDSAEAWLLAARSSTDLPGEVRQHLADCSDCVSLLNRLYRLDRVTGRLAPVPNPSARARLDAALANTPQEQPNALPAVYRKPRWVIGLVAGLAAAVLVAGGWVAGRMTSSKPVAQAPPEQPREPPEARPQEQPREQPREQPSELPRPVPPIPPVPQPQLPSEFAIAPHPAPAPGLVARVARHAVSVAADPAPAAQLDALDRLAGEVRADAVKRAGVGDLEQLPRLVGLHERILKLGVARQLARVPEQSRSALAVRTADELNQSADDIATTAGRLFPVAGDLLRPLIASCREIGTALRDGKPLPGSTEWPSPATPLESLVAQTIRMADATEPLARAGQAAQLAAVLANAVTVLSAADLPDDAARVGEAMDGVLDRGVAANLERVVTADTANQLHKEVAEVRERVGQTTDVLEKSLTKAPPAARVGLERAIAASDAGRGKASGKGKPNGPPWKKDGFPPGWSKKP